MQRLSKRYDRAVRMARRAHKDQVRKGTEIPYLSHVLAVSSIVLEMGGTEDEAIAALLHDVVEDAGAEYKELILEEFGDDVLRIVIANSDTDVKPKPPWHARKQAYLDSLPSKRRDELMVSLADKLHNSRATLLDYRRIGDDIWARFRSGNREDQLWYYDELVRNFTARADDLGPLCASKLDDFVRTVEELHGR